jgi:hypothetical protein
LRHETSTWFRATNGLMSILDLVEGSQRISPPVLERLR